MRIAYHLDEHIDPRVAYALQRHGISVTTTVEVGLRSTVDSVQFRFAIGEQRVMVTQDSDLLNLAKTMTGHSGIVFVTGGKRTVGELVRWLILIYEVMTPAEMENHIEYI